MTGMKNRESFSGHAALRAFARAVVLLCVAAAFGFASAAPSTAETRTLKLYYIHTKERAEITFKKNGRYVQSGLNKLNRFLRDWRRNEPTKMDPELFDIVWEAYKAVGGRDYIHVVSAYRSPATNAMLRRTRGGQATKSQHMVGRAMDFYIPGVKLSKLRAVGFKLQGGGVGYYPKSGSPFVHFDTGNVRAWPRMSRSELTRLFPGGKTLHLPPDGKPLPGYQQAMAEYKSRKRRGQATATVKDSGRKRNNNDGKSGGKTLLAALFGGADEEEDNAEATAPAPSRSTTVRERKPAAKPVETPGTLIAALTPRKTPRPLFAPRPQRNIPAAIQEETAVAALVPLNEPATPLINDVPLPESKPRTLVASAPQLENRRSADEIEAILRAATTETALPRATMGTVMASVNPATERFSVPLPTAAPRRVETSPAIALASLPVPGARVSGAADAPITVAYAPETARQRLDIVPMVPPAVRPDQPKTTRVPAATDPNQRIRASYDTGVTTTTKESRPTMQTASISRRNVPSPSVEDIDPSRFGVWTTAQVSVVDHGKPEDRPVFMQNALRKAPTEVYTDGFQKVAAPDPRRFSGNAVNFLTVAKFVDGEGGDGRPLMLQIPN